MNNKNILENIKVCEFFDFITNNNYYQNITNKLLFNKEQFSFKYCRQQDLTKYNVAIVNFALIINNANNKRTIPRKI